MINVTRHKVFVLLFALFKTALPNTLICCETMETTRRPRVVRRIPLLRRILNAPGDYLMRVESNFQAMDWDKLQEGFR
jgi:hypothetical protein